MQIDDLFIVPEDLYRLGNSSDARLTRVRRPQDVNTLEMNGIVIVVANGKGVSLLTRARIDKTPISGWLWRLPKGTQMPFGLRLINDRSGHFCLCPIRNMPLDEFKGLLAKLAMKCRKVSSKQASNG